MTYSNEYFTWLLIIVNKWFSNIEAVSIHPRSVKFHNILQPHGNLKIVSLQTIKPVLTT